MALQCVVPDCQSSSEFPGISMHRFPDDRLIKKAWCAKIFNDAKRQFRDLGAMYVCSVHFKPDDYEIVKEQKILKENTEPSLFLPDPCRKSEILSESLLPKKKRKLKKVENSSESLSTIEKTSEISEADSYFAHLPDIVLTQIFNYLSYEDMCNAAFVCRNWYDISRSSPLWTKVDVKVKSSLHLLKFLLILPSSVTYLNIYCNSFDFRQSLWLPDIMCRLHEHCPNINTLIIENVFFSKRFCNTSFTTDHVLRSLETSMPVSSKRAMTCRKNASQCCEDCEKINSDKYTPDNRPQKLSIFSLRYAHSFMSHLSSQISQFLPEVKVLDLTCSATIKTAAIPFFLKLTYLEELYLTECPINNSAIRSLLKHVKGLKVLDLEGSHCADYETFEIIQKYGRSLEKLFLGNTQIESFVLTDIDNVFPHLQMLCLKNTLINDNDISYFIVKLPNLKYIDGSFCENLFLLQMITLEAGCVEKQFIYTKEGEPTALCHHFKTKYM